MLGRCVRACLETHPPSPRLTSDLSFGVSSQQGAGLLCKLLLLEPSPNPSPASWWDEVVPGEIPRLGLPRNSRRTELRLT